LKFELNTILKAHTIDQNFRFKSILLDISPLDKSHTGAYLFDVFEQTIEEYDLKSKLASVISDSAANILKMFKIPFDENQEEDESFGDTPVVLEEFNSCLKEKYRYTDPRCFAHWLQLVLKSGAFEEFIKVRNSLRKRLILHHQFIAQPPRLISLKIRKT
jgi:hypothetical protein